MKVTIHVADRDPFELSVGSGKQTFKWLGLVVAQKLGHKGVSSIKFVPPVRVDTAKGAMAAAFGVNPADRIRDVVVDGGDIFVTPQTTKGSAPAPRPTDDTGALVSSPWQDEAYRRDPASEHRRKQRIAELSRKQRTRARMSKLREAALGTGSAIKVERIVQASRLSSEDLFETDWLALECLVMVPLKEDQDRLHDIVKEYYQNIRDVFRWYSNIMGKRSPDDRHAFNMFRGEFEAFVSDCRIVSSQNFKVVKPTRLFYRAAEGLKGASGFPGTSADSVMLDRVKFIDAIALLAATLAGIGAAKEFLDELPMLTPEVFQDFAEKFLRPRANRVMGASYVRQELVSRAVAREIVREMELLRAVFREYCTKTLSRKVLRRLDPDAPLTMNREQWRMFISDVGLLTGSDTGTGDDLDNKSSSAFTESKTPDRSPRTEPKKDKRVSSGGGAGGGGGGGGGGEDEGVSLPAAMAARRASQVWASRAKAKEKGGVVAIRPNARPPPGSLLTSTAAVELFGAGRGKELTDRDVTLAFYLAQADDDSTVDTDGGDTAMREITLTFAEFMEALLRISMLKWGDTTPPLPTSEMIALAIDAVSISVSLATTSGLSNLGQLTDVVKRLKNAETKAGGGGDAPEPAGK